MWSSMWKDLRKGRRMYQENNQSDRKEIKEHGATVKGEEEMDQKYASVIGAQHIHKRNLYKKERLQATHPTTS